MTIRLEKRERKNRNNGGKKAKASQLLTHFLRVRLIYFVLFIFSKEMRSVLGVGVIKIEEL